MGLMRAGTKLAAWLDPPPEGWISGTLVLKALRGRRRTGRWRGGVCRRAGPGAGVVGKGGGGWSHNCPTE